MMDHFKKHQWSSGRIVPCHGTDPGSIPGWCNAFCFIFFPLFSFSLFTISFRFSFSHRDMKKGTTEVGGLRRQISSTPTRLSKKMHDFQRARADVLQCRLVSLYFLKLTCVFCLEFDF